MPDLDQLSRELASVKKAVEVIGSRSVKNGRPGAPGRDGIGIPGAPGRDAHVDYELVGKRIEEKVQTEVAKIPIPKDGAPGQNGKDVSLEVVADLVNTKAKEYVAQIPIPQNGKDGISVKGDIGPRGPKGDKGEKGDRGEPGPRPDHEWRGSELRFELPNGEWGAYTDLRGPPGRNGSSRGVATSGGTSTASTNSYFPSGW